MLSNVHHHHTPSTTSCTSKNRLKTAGACPKTVAKAARKQAKGLSKGAQVQPRKGPQARRRKGCTKRRTGHTKPRMSGRKHKAIRKLLFAQTSLIQAEQGCAQARLRRRKALALLAWKLSRRIMRPLLLAPARLALRSTSQPLIRLSTQQPPAWYPAFILRTARPVQAWKVEEEAVAAQVGATCAGSPFLSRVLAPNLLSVPC